MDENVNGEEAYPFNFKETVNKVVEDVNSSSEDNRIYVLKKHWVMDAMDEASDPDAGVPHEPTPRESVRKIYHLAGWFESHNDGITQAFLEAGVLFAELTKKMAHLREWTENSRIIAESIAKAIQRYEQTHIDVIPVDHPVEGHGNKEENGVDQPE